eukprot:TRINITY_DN1812_c0_g1_i1.p1 TRINITY_DN1812_c0_g1~~TRINITY_DN1812_c0_g1_i1.p1  ORF type:complete len:263 (+),score=50.74 TRINITY_DN1812_c0_g1_i1:139-927(+)
MTIELQPQYHAIDGTSRSEKPEISWATICFVFGSLALLTVTLELLFLQFSALAIKAGRLAYELAALPALMTLTHYGIQEYMVSVYEDRVFGFDKESQFMAEVMAGYQTWNIIASLLYYPFSWANIGHHVVTAFAGFAAAHHFVHGYVPYCFGVFESCSLWLIVIQVFKLFKELQDNYKSFYAVIRALFAVHFLAIRILLLAPFTYSFLYDVYHVMIDPEQSSSRVNAAALMGLVCIFLTILQIIWARVIVAGVIKAARVAKA